jgi:hypothetical protein
VRGLGAYPHKLAIRNTQDGSLTATEGFNAYQYVDSTGSASLLVPDLNFFAVVRQNLSTGRRETYTNIEIGAQPQSLFQPPPGEPVTEIATPRGIRRREIR